MLIQLPYQIHRLVRHDLKLNFFLRLGDNQITVTSCLSYLGSPAKRFLKICN